MQLDGIPSLNECLNRLPSSVKTWIIEGVIQAVKEWLLAKQRCEVSEEISQPNEIYDAEIVNAFIKEVVGELQS